MPTKILKMDIQNHLQRLKKGGGTPEYEIPNNYDHLICIKNTFQDYLNRHANDSENQLYTIRLEHQTDLPPISKRFTKGMKTIIGNNKFTYKRNELLDDRLIFFYVIEKIQIEEAIERIDAVIEYIKYVTSRSNKGLQEWFKLLIEGNEEQIFLNFNENIKEFFSEYAYLSKTSFINLICTCQFFYHLRM